MLDQENDVLAIFLSEIDNLSPDGFKLLIGIRADTIDRRINALKGDWGRTYYRKSYRFADPVTAWGLCQTGCEVWTELGDPDRSDPVGFFADAHRHGLTAIAGVSISGKRSRSILELVSRSPGFEVNHLDHLEARLAELHCAYLRSGPRLTPGEIEALQLVSIGAHICQAADKLGISESAVKLRLSSARKRLNVPTTTAAIRAAAISGLI